MKTLILSLSALLCLCSCNKVVDSVVNKAISKTFTSNTSYNQTVKYTIAKGAQYCDPNGFRAVETNQMKFTVKFDSTAVYKTIQPVNQYDINKLYGFSDNNADHHQYSARLGWRWSDNALRLFAYVYNEGGMTSKELTTVPIGAEIQCSIQVAGNKYLFTVNGVTESMPRSSSTATGKGYQLYPYFGGDETAPHDIHIWIREEKP
jgi:hypothetical protein